MLYIRRKINLEVTTAPPPPPRYLIPKEFVTCNLCIRIFVGKNVCHI
jgi:hypothetical protein